MKYDLATLALLLLTANKRYDLRALIRNARIRPRRFRQIRPTGIIAGNLAAPHLAIVKAWAAQIGTILDALPYGQAAVAAAIDRAAAQVGLTVSQAQAAFPAVIAGVERWHRAQWLSRIRAATGLDVSLMTSPQDVADPAQAATSWNQALADDLHSQTKSRLTAALLVAGIAAADARARANEVIARARKRAAGIGVDQAAKAVRGMDKARADAAGLDEWTWRHLDPQPHPRPEHQRRDGNVYSRKNPPPTDVGEEPYCHCWREYRLT